MMSHYRTIHNLGTPIVLHSGITKMLGSITASCLLSHIMYWSERTDNPLGFYRSLDDLANETSLSNHELRSARQKLSELGLITENYKRTEHKLYFKFNVERFDELFSEYISTCENRTEALVKSTDTTCENHKYHLRNPQVPPAKSADTTCENRTSLYTKITTKNTTKITTENENAHARENSQNFSQIESEPIKQSVKNNNAVTERLINLGVSQQAASDFFDFRKQIKKPLTVTAIKTLVRESDKAGLSLEQAIEYTLLKGWQSFTAAYYFNNEKGSNHATHQQNHQNNAAAYAQSLQQQFNAKYGQSSTGVAVDGDFRGLEGQF